MIPTNKTQYLATLLGLVGKEYDQLTSDEEETLMKGWNALCQAEDIPAVVYVHGLIGARIVELVRTADEQRSDQLVSAIGDIDDVIAELHDILETK